VECYSLIANNSNYILERIDQVSHPEGSSPQRGGTKVARGETSGSRPGFYPARWNRARTPPAIHSNEKICARLQRAGVISRLLQTFHVWLPSSRGFAAKFKRN
jgi:hypothetical protein